MGRTSINQGPGAWGRGRWGGGGEEGCRGRRGGSYGSRVKCVEGIDLDPSLITLHQSNPHPSQHGRFKGCHVLWNEIKYILE